MLFLYMPGAATRDAGAPVGRTQLTESDALQSSLWRLAQHIGIQYVAGNLLLIGFASAHFVRTQRTGVRRFTVSVTIAGAAHRV